jgi:hypothetical protein
MRKPPNNGVGYIIDLAEIPIPGGVIRVDRSRMAFEHELTLGHYGLPHADSQEPMVRKSKVGDVERITASVRGRSLALIAYRGWDGVSALTHDGRNAESAVSTVLHARRKRTEKNPAMELMIAAFLHKMDDGVWTDEELSPIKDIRIMDITPSRSALGARIILRNGKSYDVDFKDIDGYRSC